VGNTLRRRGPDPPEPVESDVSPDAKSIAVNDQYVGLAVFTAAVLFGVRFYAQGRTLLGPVEFLSEAMSVIAFIAVMAILLDPRRLSPRMAQIALMLGASVLVIHNQIEMTFYNMQACLVAYVMLAAAAGAGVGMKTRPPAKDAPVSVIPADLTIKPAIKPERWGLLNYDSVFATIILMIGCGVMLVGYVIPEARQQRALEHAAELLQQRRSSEAMAQLQRAIDVLPRDPRPYEDKAMLELEGAEYFVRQGDMAEGQRYMSLSLATLNDAFKAGLEDVSLHRRRAQVYEAWGRMFHEAGFTYTGAREWVAVLRRTPYGLEDTLHLADLAWQIGERNDAVRYYLRAKKISANYYLDPARQLTEDQLNRVEERIKSHTQ
jgi:hypothetical protein